MTRPESPDRIRSINPAQERRPALGPSCDTGIRGSGAIESSMHKIASGSFGRLPIHLASRPFKADHTPFANARDWPNFRASTSALLLGLSAVRRPLFPPAHPDSGSSALVSSMTQARPQHPQTACSSKLRPPWCTNHRGTVFFEQAGCRRVYREVDHQLVRRTSSPVRRVSDCMR